MLGPENGWLHLAVLAMASICAVVGPMTALADAAPFGPGEKLKYVLRWENIPAGETNFEIRPTQQINGVEAYHFVMTTETNGFASLFFKLRERVEAYAETGLKRSMGYKKKQTEGKHQRDEVIEFDWVNGKAQYSNFGKSREPIDLMPGSLDPLSAFYYTRMALAANSLQIKRAVTNGKKTFYTQATMIGREKITLSNGKTYDTYRVIPAMGSIGGVFEDDKDAQIYIWVTADEKCIPVRFKSKLAVGHFIGELISADGV